MDGNAHAVEGDHLKWFEKQGVGYRPGFGVNSVGGEMRVVEPRKRGLTSVGCRFYNVSLGEEMSEVWKVNSALERRTCRTSAFGVRNVQRGQGIRPAGFLVDSSLTIPSSKLQESVMALQPRWVSERLDLRGWAQTLHGTLQGEND
jgi:hypothetical protein